MRDRIKKYGHLIWKKCLIKVQELDFIGDHLSAEGVSPSKEKMQAIADMATPTSKDDIQRP